jgi:hypothetical protein
MIDRTLLHSYVDGELSAAERQLVESEIARCTLTSAEVEAIRNFKRHAYQGIEIPDHTAAWNSCRARIREIDRSDKASIFVLKNGWALAAGIALVIAVGGYVSRAQSGARLSTVDLAGSVLSGRGPSENQVQGQNRLEAMLRNVDMKLRQLRATGSRQVNLNGMLAEEIELEDLNGNQLSLIIISERVRFEAMEPMKNTEYLAATLPDGKRIVCWTRFDKTLVLAGDRPSEVLAEIATANFGQPE